MRTTSKVAAEFNVSPVTIRLWMREFGSDIGVWKTDNGRYVYSDSVVRQLRQIQTALGNDNTYADIHKLFENGSIDEIGLDKLSVATSDPSMQALTEAITTVIDQQNDLIRELLARIESLENLLVTMPQLPPATDTVIALLPDNTEPVLLEEPAEARKTFRERWRERRNRGNPTDSGAELV